MPNVTNIEAREILDSRGLPTLEVDVRLSDESVGRASVPSGKSTGSKEAVEWRDARPDRYGGKGVVGAIRNIRQIVLPSVNGKSFDSQEAFDRFLIDLDGSSDKHHLGANVVLGCSMAFARAMSAAKRVHLVQYLSTEFG